MVESATHIFSKERIALVRKDFPILTQQINARQLVYLDNGATTQKPLAVIDAVTEHYRTINSNIHRGVHTLSQRSTEAYELAREKVRVHLNAKESKEVIFTKGTTEAINLVAFTIGNKCVEKGDEVLITAMEHHSNILPWQHLCERKGAKLVVASINDDGTISIDDYRSKLNSRTKMVAFTHVSNTLGTINPVKEMTALAKEKGAYVLVDGAQAIPHMHVDVQDLGIDFYCFSGHKVYAPTGIGVLYANEEVLDQMDNYQIGGGTIKTVSFQKTEYADSPLRFEAGTPPIEAAIGLGIAIDYLNELGLENVSRYENELLNKATSELQNVEGLKVIGEAKEKAAVVSFVVEGIHPYDVGTILDKMGVAVRTGHHCTQPLMEHYQIPGTIRASFAFYNTFEEVDILVQAVNKAVKMLS